MAFALRVANNAFATGMSSTNSRLALIIDSQRLLIIAGRPSWLLRVGTRACGRAADAGFVALVLCLASDTFAQIFPRTEAATIADVIDKQGSLVITSCAFLLERVAASAGRFITSTCLMALTLDQTDHVFAPRMSTANAGSTLVVDSVATAVVACRAVWFGRFRALACLMITHASLVALVLRSTDNTFAQILPNAHAIAITLIIHSHNTSIIAHHNCIRKGMAAHAGRCIALSPNVALSGCGACHTFTTAMACTSARSALIIDGHVILVIACSASWLGWFGTLAILVVANPSFVALILR